MKKLFEGRLFFKKMLSVMVQNLKQLLSHDLIFIDENSNMTDNWELVFNL